MGPFASILPDLRYVRYPANVDGSPRKRAANYRASIKLAAIRILLSAYDSTL
jgi:hypothetical protein